MQSRAAAVPTNDLSGSTSPPLLTQPATAQVNTAHSDPYSRQLSNEGFDPAIVKAKGGGISYSPDNSRSSVATGTSASGAQFVSGASGGGTSSTQMPGINTSPHGINISSANVLSTTGVPASSGGGGGGDTLNRLDSEGDEGGRGRSGSEGFRERSHTVGSVGSVGGERESKVRSNSKRDRYRQKEGFSVDSIHNQRSPEDMAREYEQQLAEMREQLEVVTKEKDDLVLSRERVSSQWESKVRRLKRKLQQRQGEEGGEGVSKCAVLCPSL